MLCFQQLKALWEYIKVFAAFNIDCWFCIEELRAAFASRRFNNLPFNDDMIFICSHLTGFNSPVLIEHVFLGRDRNMYKLIEYEASSYISLFRLQEKNS